MIIARYFLVVFSLSSLLMFSPSLGQSQNLPLRYLTLELFTNTPCPICASQNPGLFNRLQNVEGEYHLISFYPGRPYNTCIFYQANISENNTRYQHYTGDIFGSPTVALNGVDFRSSSGVTTNLLNQLTGSTSWLHIGVTETPGTTRTVDIALLDAAGGSMTTGRLFAVIVEKEIMYNAPNGETLHHNVFRRFLTPATGDDVDMSTGSAELSYQYTVESGWNASETYVIAWLSDPATKEIINSGTRFDPEFTTSIDPIQTIFPLSIYPNPASSEIQFSLPSGVTTNLVQVYDQQGRLVRTSLVSPGTEIRLSVYDLPGGRYIARIAAGSVLYTGSFEVVR